MEDITDADYVHAKKVCKDFEIKHLGEYRGGSRDFEMGGGKGCSVSATMVGWQRKF